jgi:hypothetical protein
MPRPYKSTARALTPCRLPRVRAAPPSAERCRHHGSQAPLRRPANEIATEQNRPRQEFPRAKPHTLHRFPSPGACRNGAAAYHHRRPTGSAVDGMLPPLSSRGKHLSMFPFPSSTLYTAHPSPLMPRPPAILAARSSTAVAVNPEIQLTPLHSTASEHTYEILSSSSIFSAPYRSP